LPVLNEDKIVTLGEGGTELVEGKRLSEILGIDGLYLKDETRNPTGAFKDRETTVLATKALEAECDVISIVSTGNAACSVAAYAARSGLRSFIIVPPTAPVSKLVQISMYGAKVLKVRGNTDEQAKLLAEACRRFGWYNANPGINPYKMEGSKTLAYEVCEQLDWRSPDYVFVPIGNGGLLAGVWKGFEEFRKLGFCSDTPRIIGVESENARAVADAVKAGRTDVLPVDATSIASGINVSFPLNAKKAIKAVVDSQGSILTVSDEEILEAQRLLASKEGIFAEPAGAASLAGVKRFSEDEGFDRGDIVVSLATGAGLKDMGILLKEELDIPEIGSTFAELESVSVD
jgi:threonine synthase